MIWLAAIFVFSLLGSLLAWGFCIAAAVADAYDDALHGPMHDAFGDWPAEPKRSHGGEA